LKKLLFTFLFASACLPAFAGTAEVPLSYAERGLPFPVSKKGATINIAVDKITDIAISDKSCVVYSQIQNSIYVKALSPCLKFDGVSVPDRNPILRAWLGSKILEFQICSGCKGSKNITVVADKRVEPIRRKLSFRASEGSLPVPSLPKTKPVAIAPPPPEVDPTNLIQQVTSSPASQDSIPVSVGQPFPLLKPLPQVDSFPVEQSKLLRRKVKRSRKLRIEAPVAKVEVKPIDQIQPIEAQENLSPSQRALTEIKSSSMAPQPQRIEELEAEKPVSIEKNLMPQGKAKPYSKKAITLTPKKRAIAKLRTRTKSIKAETPRTFKLALNQSQAKALLKGLNIARLKKGEGRIAYRSRNWMAIQDVIYFLKVNNSLDAAIQKARASKPLVEKLMGWGGFGA